MVKRLIPFLWIFCASRLIAGDTLYVRVNDSWQSRLLVAEWTRDWSRTAEGKRYELARLNEQRAKYRTIFIIDHWMIGDLPEWCFDRWGRFTPYPREAFRMTTLPYLATRWLHLMHCYERERYEWELDCDWGFTEYSDEEELEVSPPAEPPKPWKLSAAEWRNMVGLCDPID